MTRLDVDPTTYYRAATNCFDAAAALRDSFVYVFGELSECGAMAGVDTDGQQWATSYDTSAYQVVGMFTDVHATLTAYGSALNDLGFNHAQADASLHGTPQPQRPQDPQTPFFGPYSCPASAGGPGQGLIDDGINIASQVGIPVPDGDTGKITRAADAWDRLGTIYQNTNARDKITIAATLFDDVTSPDAVHIRDDLTMLSGAIDQMLTACQQIRDACNGYKNALTELRNQIKGFLHDLAEELAIDAAITIGLTLISFGAGAVTAAKAVDTVRRWGKKIRDAIRTWRTAKAAQIAGRTQTAKDELAKASKAVRDLFDRLRKKGKEPEKPPAPGPTFERPPEVPEGWVARTADNGKGVVWQKPGSSGNADTVRVMDPTERYPDGYVRFYNSHGQPVDLAGKPGPNSATHIPKNPDGSFSKPKGW